LATISQPEEKTNNKTEEETEEKTVTLQTKM
jgi:hypothetical protein